MSVLLTMYYNSVSDYQKKLINISFEFVNVKRHFLSNGGAGDIQS